MAQITDTLIAEYERAHADGKHAPMTIGEEQQLIHAWKQQHPSQQSPARVEELDNAEIIAMIDREGIPWDDIDAAIAIGNLFFEAGQRALNQRLAVKEGEALYVEARRCSECDHIGINDGHATDAACHNCDWTGPSPEEDKCPGCGKENCMGVSCPKCSNLYELVDDKILAAPQSTHPVSDDQQAKDAALWNKLVEIMGRGEYIHGSERHVAIDFEVKPNPSKPVPQNVSFRTVRSYEWHLRATTPDLREAISSALSTTKQEG